MTSANNDDADSSCIVAVFDSWALIPAAAFTGHYTVRSQPPVKT